MLTLDTSEVLVAREMLLLVQKQYRSFVRSQLEKNARKTKALMDQINQLAQASRSILSTTTSSVNSVESAFCTIRASGQLPSPTNAFSAELLRIKQTGRFDKNAIIQGLLNIGLGYILPRTELPGKKVFIHDAYVSKVRFAPSDKYLATSCATEAIVLDLNTGNRLTGFVHKDRVSALAFYSDSVIGTGTVKGVVTIWNLRDLERIIELQLHTASINDIVFSHDYQYLLTASKDKTAKLYNLRSWSVVELLLHSKNVSAARFSPDGKIIATASEWVKLWRTQTGTELLVFNRHQNIVTALEFSPVGPYIVSGGVDKKLIVWNYETGEIRWQLTGHNRAINCVDFSPCGKFVASGTGQGVGIVKLWNATTGAFIREYKEHRAFVNSVEFSHDGSRLSSGGSEKKAVVRPVNQAYREINS